MERSARQIVNDNGRILFAKFFQQRIPLESFLVQIPSTELWGDSNIYCHHQFRSRTKWLQQQSPTNFSMKIFSDCPRPHTCNYWTWSWLVRSRLERQDNCLGIWNTWVWLGGPCRQRGPWEPLRMGRSFLRQLRKFL